MPERMDISVDSIEVLRTDERAPYLSWLNGVWRNEPLPGTARHSGDWAVCALIEPYTGLESMLNL